MNSRFIKKFCTKILCKLTAVSFHKGALLLPIADFKKLSAVFFNYPGAGLIFYIAGNYNLPIAPLPRFFQQKPAHLRSKAHAAVIGHCAVAQIAFISGETLGRVMPYVSLGVYNRSEEHTSELQSR